MTDRFTFADQVHGAGGFAKVIKGRDNVLERNVAVKVLNPLATEFSKTEQERFRREARILASLSHPHIPSIYDVSFSGGETFLIVFQFIEGVTLRAVIDQGLARSMTLSLGFIRLHRPWITLMIRELFIETLSLKTSSSCLTGNLLTSLILELRFPTEDAKKLTASGWAIGTAGYMSPEQQAGEPVDARSDVYSIGVTLYEALAGKRIPVGDYEPLSAGNEAIPPEIDDLIRASVLPKERRLDSAKTFSQKLLGALRPSKPLSETLVHGKLHELAAAIEQLSPVEFTRLPKGQQSLILAKVADIVNSGETNLEYAAEQFLELLLNLCILVDKENYRGIVLPAVSWAFEKRFYEQTGRDSIRRALERAAHQASGESYEVLREEFVEFLKRAELDDQEDWYLHAVRNVLQTLLANPACTSGEEVLVEAFEKVNRIQRSRSRE